MTTVGSSIQRRHLFFFVGIGYVDGGRQWLRDVDVRNADAFFDLYQRFLASAKVKFLVVVACGDCVPAAVKHMINLKLHNIMTLILVYMQE